MITDQREKVEFIHNVLLTVTRTEFYKPDKGLVTEETKELVEDFYDQIWKNEMDTFAVNCLVGALKATGFGDNLKLYDSGAVGGELFLAINRFLDLGGVRFTRSDLRLVCGDAAPRYLLPAEESDAILNSEET